MQDLYYNTEHPSSFGGVAGLGRAAGTSRLETVEWLRSQRPYTLHKPVRKRNNTRAYKNGSIDQQWQGDLVEMIP